MKLSDYVFDFVSKTGVNHVFFLPGGGCMHLVDSLGKRTDLKSTCCLHEQAAVIAAEGYSQYTNNLGVALVTTGPGSTNAITGVAGAWIDSTPLLIISGQAKRSDLIGNLGVRQMGIQEVDIVSMVKPITKYAVTVMEPNMIKYHLQKALHLAEHGRKGPVWIDLPLDVQGSIIDEKNLEEFKPEKEISKVDIRNPQSVIPAKAGIQHFQQLLDPDFRRDDVLGGALRKKAIEVAKLIAASKKPVILAGNGIRLCGAIPEFEKLIEKLRAPVLLTWKAGDFLFEDHDLYCGKPGIIGQRGANFTQQNSDLIITLGARLDLCQVGHNYPNFAPRAKKVIVDIDEHEIGKIKTSIDIAVSGDVGQFIKELLAELKDIPDFSNWLSQSKELHNKYPVMLPEYKKPNGLVNPYFLMDVFSKVLTDNDVIVPGSSGGCAEITQQAIRLKKGQRMLNTPGLGSMGFGLPASFGVCIASEGKRTISIIGDGGLQHNIQEFATLASLNLPIKMFVLNNNGYASIRNMQRAHFKGHLVACDGTSGLALPDTLKVAAAYGLKTKRINDQTNLEQDVKAVLETEGTVICEVMIDPDVPTAPRMSSEARPDGSMVSKPMEDLWPFLDRKEFEGNMK